MNYIIVSFQIFILSFIIPNTEITNGNSTVGSYEALSVELLKAVKAGRPTEEIQDKLNQATVDDLAAELDTDAEKKAFWMNIYNSYIIILLRDNPGLFDDRSDFFSSDWVPIAGHKISFDDIEHGYIRRSKVKLGLGLIGNPFPGELEKKFRVDKVDPRIHFALNCGAKSCPPVRVYHAAKIDEQLDKAAAQYLEKTTQIKEEGEKVIVTVLMSWFRGDFDGKEGSIEMLKRYDVIPEGADPSIDYSDYDWTLDLTNFAT